MKLLAYSVREDEKIFFETYGKKIRDRGRNEKGTPKSGQCKTNGKL